MEDKNTTKLDIEFYLLNREYSDLTPDEMKIVAEYVDSEQEFNDMKIALLGVGNFFEKEKELEPNPAIKAALLREFEKQHPAGGYWLNGIFVSLFPKEKKLFQKPGFQLIGLAASVMLIITFTFNFNGDINSTELAQNDEVLNEDELVQEKIVKNDLQTTKDISGVEKSAAEKKKAEQDLINQPFDNDSNGRGDALSGGYAVSEESAPSPPSEEVLLMDEEIEANDLSDNRNMNGNAPSGGVFDSKLSKSLTDDETMADKLVISGTTTPTTDIVETVSASVVSMDSDMEQAEMEGTDLPINSRTLAEDADLIGILYTAM